MSWAGAGKEGFGTLHLTAEVQGPGPREEKREGWKNGVLQGQEKVLQGQEERKHGTEERGEDGEELQKKLR